MVLSLSPRVLIV
ncbi:hypothetical protein CP061683_0556A, partial [Chlamydia psittaci 06-1683]